MRIRAVFTTTKQWIQRHPRRTGLLVCVTLLFVGGLVTLWPRTITFAYSGRSCTDYVVPFPQLIKPSNDATYELTLEDDVSIGGYPVLSRALCAQAHSVPSPASSSMNVALFGWSLLSTSVTVRPTELPAVSTGAFNKPVAATKSVELPFSRPDTLFTYVVKANSKQAACTAAADGGRAVCELERLGLEQGTREDIAVERHFDGKHVTTLASKQVDILPAVTVKKSSIKKNQMIYGAPKSFQLTLDKPLVSAKAELVKTAKNAVQAVAATVSVKDAVVTVTPTKRLARPAAYELRLQAVTARDGSALEKPMTLPFKMSDGPQVKSISIGKDRVEPTQPIVLTFDQPLKSGQALDKLLRIKGVQASVRQASSTQVYVSLASAGRCQPFTVAISKGLVGKNNVKSSKSWQYTSRTRCSTTETIGFSRQGRAIQAYLYGSGARTYLYTGAIHGNEISSSYTMKRFMAELEENPTKLPKGVTVAVVPVVNPDGAATASRDNNKGVNLNRNFPTANWRKNIPVANGKIDKGGGGPSAGSEPETRALMNFTARISPRLVISHHSQGGLVNSNDVGSSITAGQAYSRAASYRFIPNSATTATFGFEMTGTYEDWLLERGTAAILIELDGHGGDYYWRNGAAMWAMLRQ